MNKMSINKEEKQPRRTITREVNCLECNKNFLIKFVNSSKDYGKKNNWGYWTERAEYNNQYICSDCLKRMYYEDYMNFRKKTTERRRKVFRTYLTLKVL